MLQVGDILTFLLTMSGHCKQLGKQWYLCVNLLDTDSEKMIYEENRKILPKLLILGSSDPYVKFKYKERVVYKSNIVYKSLNPVWEEEFQILMDDMTTPISIEVYDYDRFCTDDYMGGASLDVSRVKWFTWVFCYI